MVQYRDRDGRLLWGGRAPFELRKRAFETPTAAQRPEITSAACSFTRRQTARRLRKAAPGRLRGTGMAWRAAVQHLQRC
jgi:hypothetical protein